MIRLACWSDRLVISTPASGSIGGVGQMEQQRAGDDRPAAAGPAAPCRRFMGSRPRSRQRAARCPAQTTQSEQGGHAQRRRQPEHRLGSKPRCRRPPSGRRPPPLPIAAKRALRPKRSARPRRTHQARVSAASAGFSMQLAKPCTAWASNTGQNVGDSAISSAGRGDPDQRHRRRHRLAAHRIHQHAGRHLRQHRRGRTHAQRQPELRLGPAMPGQIDRDERPEPGLQVGDKEEQPVEPAQRAPRYAIATVTARGRACPGWRPAGRRCSRPSF